jgi:hypothetical protein
MVAKNDFLLELLMASSLTLAIVIIENREEESV